MRKASSCPPDTLSHLNPEGFVVLGTNIYPQMQIPAGWRRQGSAGKMTDGGWFIRWPVKDPRSN
jgi:hypothetical protein